jgi:hypothetical protein
MTQAAVREWLYSTLVGANIGLEIFDRRFKSTPTSDMVLVFSFESEENALTMGDAGAIYEAIYRPELIILLADPSAEAAQGQLDQYTQKIRDALRSAPRNVPLTDSVTGKTSTLSYVHPRIPIQRARVEDVSEYLGEEADVMATVALQPTICETFIKGA